MSSPFPAIPDLGGTVENSRSTVIALKQAVELLTGQNRGSDQYSAVNSQDLQALRESLTTKITTPFAKFKAVRDGTSQVGLTSGHYNEIIWTSSPINVTASDGNTAFDVGTGKLQPSEAGIWNVTLQIFCTGATVGGYVSAALFFNINTFPNLGGQIAQGLTVVASATGAASPISIPVEFNGTTDYVKAAVYIDHTGAGALDGYPYNTYFYANKVQ